MPFLMVCDLAVAPVPPEVCPVDHVLYYQNFWDSGLTLDQTSALIGGVLALWAVAYIFTVLKRIL
jgi:hypothetical protein